MASEDDPILPLHTSLRDFLVDSRASGRFAVDLGDCVHSELGLACLKIINSGLKFNACELPGFFPLNREIEDLPDRVRCFIPPELGYACCWTASHLLSSLSLVSTHRIALDIAHVECMTPLSRAVWNSDEVVMKLLLDTGEVDVETRDKEGMTPLSRAVWNGANAVAKLLLKTGKVDLEARDVENMTPLLRAVRNRDETMLKLLLDTGQVDVEATDADGMTPLSRAEVEILPRYMFRHLSRPETLVEMSFVRALHRFHRKRDITMLSLDTKLNYAAKAKDGCVYV